MHTWQLFLFLLCIIGCAPPGASQKSHLPTIIEEKEIPHETVGSRDVPGVDDDTTTDTDTVETELPVETDVVETEPVETDTVPPVETDVMDDDTTTDTDTVETELPVEDILNLTGRVDAPMVAETFAVTFETRRCVDLEALAISAGDLNGDGEVDIVGANCEETVFFSGNGDGTLGPAQLINLGVVTDVAVFGPYMFDFDRDGLLDLLRLGTEGVRAWRNEGNLVFSPFDGNLGITLRQGEGLPTTATFTDLNLDGFLDLFVGYNSIRMVDGATGAYLQHTPEECPHLQPALFLGQADGTFVEEPLPETHRWYALHALPMGPGTILLVNDFGDQGVSPSSTIYRWTSEGVTATYTYEPGGINYHTSIPMGGVWEDLFGRDGRPEIALSDTTSPPLLQQSGDLWFESSNVFGYEIPGWSWSVASDDFDLNGETDLAVGLANFPFPRLVQRTDFLFSPEAGVRIYMNNGVRFEMAVPNNTNEAVGIVLADLDNDGIREIIARETDPGSVMDLERKLYVLRQTSSRPRAEMVFAPSCYGGTVDVDGAARRQILPFGNTGSYGNGTPTITFAVPPEGTTATVVDVYGRVQTIPLPADRRVSVDCTPSL